MSLRDLPAPAAAAVWKAVAEAIPPDGLPGGSTSTGWDRSALLHDIEVGLRRGRPIAPALEACPAITPERARELAEAIERPLAGMPVEERRRLLLI